MLINLVVLPLIFSILILFIPNYKIQLIKQLSLFFSLVVFLYSLFFYLMFDVYTTTYQFLHVVKFWKSINYTIGLDGISLFFILLSTFLIPICLLVNWGSIVYRFKEFALILFLLEFFLINVFISLDFFFFYIFFEAVLIPMFIMIGIWGSRERKIHAAYQFFLYTFLGSVFMLVALILIYLHVGSTNIELILQAQFSEYRQLIIWFAIFVALAVKVPMYPFHIWLPEAHVEAPTSGSILLAGILLKLGTYGFVRLLLPLFPYALIYFKPFVFMVILISIIYGSFVTIRQIDLKKIIAYSSVVHMNFALLGLFTNNVEGMQGSLYVMLSHGIVSSALFFAIGVLYDRYHTRIIFYYGGLIYYMPIFSCILLIFILSNMGFPGTSSFVGEILILIAIFGVNEQVAIVSSLGMLFSAIYSIWFYNRLVFGELRLFNHLYLLSTVNQQYLFYKNWFLKFADLTKREFFIFLPLVFLNLYLGVYPNVILNYTYMSILKVLN